MRKNVLKGITLVLFILTLTGCASNLYVWNDYSNMKYKNVKENTVSARDQYKKSLFGIISSSESFGKKVPPGIYCELGQIFVKEGKKEQAIDCFNNERTLYPESATFVGLCISQFTEVPVERTEAVIGNSDFRETVSTEEPLQTEVEISDESVQEGEIND